jgi:hypothetical protein
MLYSRTLEDSKFNYFKSFLSHIVVDGDEDYESLVKPIIADAHDLSVGTKDYYSINRNGFPIISFLVKKAKPFFAKIDPDSISKDDYERILEMVSEQREVTSIHE